jgi:hypothetical protein
VEWQWFAIVPHVLRVSALEQRYPVSDFILPQPNKRAIGPARSSG